MIIGRVTEVEGDMFAALVTVDDEPEVLAVIPVAMWPGEGPEPGEIFRVLDGKVQPILTPPMTDDEWQALRERAHARYEKIRRLIE